MTFQCGPSWNACAPNPPTGEDIAYLPMQRLLSYFRTRQIRVVDALEAYIGRIERLNPLVNAFVHTQFDEARAAAVLADERYDNGTARKLEGLPIATKDLFDWEMNVPNTFGSAMFAPESATNPPPTYYPFLPPYTAIYVMRLLDAGAISLGKTATPEFGHKGITASPAWGDTQNPLRLGLNPGGSSGGASAALASFMVASAEGSDAGGSIRIPAAPTGIVGFKATAGLIPQGVPPFPVNPFLHSGPMDRTVYGVAVMADLMVQPYPPDPFSVTKPNFSGVPSSSTGYNFEAQLERGVRGLRIGITDTWDIYPVEQPIRDVINQVGCVFEQAGAVVETGVHLGLDEAIIHTTGETLTQGDVSTWWNESMGTLYAGGVVNYFAGFGIDVLAAPEKLTPEWYELVQLGQSLPATRIRDIESDTQAIRSAFDAAWRVNGDPNGYDLIIGPTLAALPQQLINAGDGSTVGPSTVGGVAVDPNIGWCCTCLQNFTGEPAVSIPAGCYDGLPIGMQIVGPRLSDERVLAAARTFERLRPWYDTLYQPGWRLSG